MDEKIGGGTFGEVWRARHHVWADQLGAVKLPTDTRYVRNLQKQGIAVHNIVHPNVVRAIGCDPYADPPYLTMEYVPGTSLRPLITDKRLTIPEAIAVMGHVLQGLKCAHEKGLLHLDIKPENILIHERALRDGFGLQGIVKITDFGVGAAAATTAAESIVFSDSLKSSDGKNLVGTLAYIAPEQRDGGAPDQTADLYACGVVLYEMLTGERPAGTDLPSDVNPTVPKFLDEVFRRAYSRRDKRFASADAFLKALAASETAIPKQNSVSPPRTEGPQPGDAPAAAASPPPLPDTQSSAPAPASDIIELPGDPNLIAFDEINKKPITNPDELKAAFRHLYHLRQLSGEEIDRIRKRLTAWADSIPHHKITEFGQCIKINQAVIAPYYWFTLRTQYESREVERKEEPYRGSRLPALVTNEGNIRIWAYPFVLIEDFTAAKNEYRVEDSQEVKGCHPCKTTGKVTCEPCAGKGRVDCPTCDARGNVPCSGCGGSGSVTRYRQETRFRDKTEYRTVTKYRAGASVRDAFGNLRQVQEPYNAQEPYKVQEQYTVDVPYQEMCPGCGGRGTVTCQTCNGTKEVRCETCVGTGQVTCQNCDGQGKVVSFLLIHDAFEPAEDSRPHPNPNLRQDCTNMLDVTNDYRVLLCISRPVFTPSIADSLGNTSLKGIIADAIEASKASCGAAKRIIKQSIDIQRANVVFVKYTYENAEHELCLCGGQLQVLAPHSPISKVTEGIFVRAAKLLDTDEIATGLNELSKTFDMGQRNDKARSLLEAFRAKLSAAYMAEATLLSKEGLWPDSLYYSDRAKVLVPRSPSVAQHEAKIKTRVAFLHLGPPIGIGIAAIVLTVLLQQPLILLAAVAAIGAGIACQFLVGLKIRGTMQALVHSSTLAVALALSIGGTVCSDTPAFALLALAIIVTVDFLLFKILKSTLLRSDPPKDISDDPHEAIQRISKLVSEDWQNIGPNYLALPSLSSHAGHMKQLDAKAEEAETQRQANADAITEQYKARVSQLGQGLVDGFDKLLPLIGGYTEALNHQNARKLQSVGPEIQKLGQSFCQQIAEFEKLCKSLPDSIEVKHDDGRKERVKLQIDIAQNASMTYIQAIKPIAQGAANILKDPAKSLMEIAKHLPNVQAAMAQVQRNEPSGVAAAH